MGSILNFSIEEKRIIGIAPNEETKTGIGNSFLDFLYED